MPPPNRHPLAAGLMAVVLVSFAACGGTQATPSTVPPSAAPASGWSLERVVDGLVSPLAVTNAGDGSGRIFVLEQGGQIRIVRDGQLLGDPFLNIGERLTAGGERGLLGLAFHPDFPDDPRFFVNYTDLDGNTVVSSFT